MDTEYFLLKRREIEERLDNRRLNDLSSYPFRMGMEYGLQLPSWMRWAMTLMPKGGMIGNLMQIGLPLAAPFLFKKRAPIWSRILGYLIAPKS